MDKETEEEYNKRQAEPLFHSAKDMVPMEQVKQVYENLQCGYKKRDGCELLVRDKSFYACIWHQSMQATGTDFFMYYNLINDNELSRMSSEQHRKLEERRKYEEAWMNNFPRGATP